MNYNKLKELHKTELIRFSDQKKKHRRLWNICEETAQFLFNNIIDNKPDRILEIGTSNGYSTFWLSLAAEKTDSTVDSIEVDELRSGLARKNLIGRENINLLFGLAENIIPDLKFKYDFVFIDAGKIGYIDYIKLLINKLKPGAVIIADNVISHKDTVRDYLDYIKRNDLFDTETLNIGSGLEVSIYNSNKKEN